MTRLRYLSLFSGMGGFDAGLDAAGMECVGQCEIDPHATAVLAHHWPDVPRFSDIRELKGGAVGAVDLLCGGFPCQDLSVAGKRAGLAGARTGLFWEFVRLVDECRPRWVLLENVPGLLSSNKGRDMAAVVGALAERGYGWAYRVLDAQFFGVPQRRRRVFIVGCLGEIAAAVQVLFESESCGRDTPPRRTSGQDLAGTLGGGAGNRGWADDTDRMTFVPMAFDMTQVTSWANRQRVEQGRPAPTLHEQGGAHITYGIRTANTSSNGWGVQEGVTHTLDGASPHAVAQPLRANRWGGSDSHGDEGNVVLEALSQQGYNTGIGGDGYARTSEADARTLLRELRQAVGEEAFAEWGLGILDSLQSQEVLRPALHGRGVRGTPDRYHKLVSGTPASTGDGSSWSVRSLWETFCQRRTPHGWQPSEQLAGQLGTHLSELSRPDASRRAFLRALWESAQGIRVLREALSAIQEVGQPAIHQAQSTQPAYNVRRLTPLEALRLQGFPDSWLDGLNLSDSAKYRLCGNAVAVPVAAWIARRIVAG